MTYLLYFASATTAYSAFNNNKTKKQQQTNTYTDKLNNQLTTCFSFSALLYPFFSVLSQIYTTPHCREFFALFYTVSCFFYNAMCGIVSPGLTPLRTILCYIRYYYSRTYNYSIFFAMFFTLCSALRCTFYYGYTFYTFNTFLYSV